MTECLAELKRAIGDQLIDPLEEEHSISDEKAHSRGVPHKNARDHLP
jgi:hypothetical protein